METGSIATVDGATLAYQVDGVSQLPPLLLLQGQSNSHHWWDSIRPALRANFRTISFDYRGTGSSSFGDVPWSTSVFAGDAASILSKLRIDCVGVYGTSMGGRVAQMLAIEHPGLVHRLVLACTSPGGPRAQERSNEIRRSLANPDRGARRRALMDLFYTPAWAKSSTLLGDPTMSAQALRLHLRVSKDHDASSRLHEIVAPTLVLHGSDDFMVPTANAAELSRAIPNSQMEITAGGRHGFFDEFSTDITPRVVDFFRS